MKIKDGGNIVPYYGTKLKTMGRRLKIFWTMPSPTVKWILEDARMFLLHSRSGHVPVQTGPFQGEVQGITIFVTTTVPVLVVNTPQGWELVRSFGFQITLSLHDMEVPTPQISVGLRHTSVGCLQRPLLCRILFPMLVRPPKFIRNPGDFIPLLDKPSFIGVSCV